MFGIITAEAVRAWRTGASGKASRSRGEQVQWALEHLDLDAKRLKELGATGFMPPLDTSCTDHEGSGLVRFARWDDERRS